MVLDVNKDVVLFGLLQKFLVVLKQLDSWFCYQDVDAALNGVQSDGVVGGVRCEDCDFARSAASSQRHRFLRLTGTALGKSINRGLVRVRIGLALLWEFLKGNIEAVVCLRNVLLEVLAW